MVIWFWVYHCLSSQYKRMKYIPLNCYLQLKLKSNSPQIKLSYNNNSFVLMENIDFCLITTDLGPCCFQLYSIEYWLIHLYRRLTFLGRSVGRFCESSLQILVRAWHYQADQATPTFSTVTFLLSTSSSSMDSSSSVPLLEETVKLINAFLSLKVFQNFLLWC